MLLAGTCSRAVNSQEVSLNSLAEDEGALSPSGCRYNEFHELHEKIKKQYPEASLKLPGKRIWGNNFDPEFIRARREGLHDFVVKLIQVCVRTPVPHLSGGVVCGLLRWNGMESAGIVWYSEIERCRLLIKVL